MRHRSLFGFLFSFLFHGLLAFAIIWLVREQTSAISASSVIADTSISMEMMMATVAEEPAPVVESVKEPEPEPEPKEEVPDPTKKEIEKPKPKEKPKEKTTLKEKPKPKEKPKEQPKKVVAKAVEAQPFAVKAKETMQGNATVSTKATGATNGGKTTNPNLAGSGASTSELDAYRSALRREIERHKKYSQRAKMMRKQGVVSVTFNVEANGSITGARIVSSSGSEDLDNSALNAVKSAKSIGPRPAGMGSTLTVPIKFSIE